MTARLAAELAGAMPADRAQAIPIALIVALLQALAVVLRQCQPVPSGAAEWLREPEGLSVVARWFWRRDIRRAVADHWAGPSADLPAVQRAVLARIRRGVSQMTVRRLYAEARP